MEQFLYKNISFSLSRRDKISPSLTQFFKTVPISVPENIENQPLKLSGLVGNDFVKLSEDGCIMYNRQTRAFLVSNKKNNTLKMREETAQYYCLNNMPISTTHTLFVYGSALKVIFIVFFDLNDKTIKIRNILSECYRIDEMEMLRVFNLFFKNKCERIIIETENNDYSFAHFLFLGRNLFYRDMMELDNRNLDFSYFNETLKNSINAVKKFEEEYDTLQRQSRDDFFLHASRFQQIKNFPSSIPQINNYILRYNKQKYDIRVNAIVANLKNERKDDLFLFDFTGGTAFERSFVESIIANLCLRNCFYLYKDGVKIYSLNRNFILFTVFLRELISEEKVNEVLKQIKDNGILVFEEKTICDNVRVYISLFKYIFGIENLGQIVVLKKMEGQA